MYLLSQMTNKMFISSSNHQTRVFHTLGLLSLVLLMQRVGATEFRVGDSKGWTPNDVSYAQWAQMKRFQVGDSLLFVYQDNKDSVLQVNKDDFDKCNTSSPIATFTDGNTSFKFKQSGPHYFISGISENCFKNEKLVVIVLADRNNKRNNVQLPPPPNTNQTTMAPPPPNTNQTTMAPPPPNTNDTTTASPPSPPPSPPLSPPSGDVIPSPAPVGEEAPSPPTPSANAASSTFASFLGCLGTAFIGSLVLLFQ